MPMLSIPSFDISSFPPFYLIFLFWYYYFSIFYIERENIERGRGKKGGRCKGYGKCKWT